MKNRITHIIAFALLTVVPTVACAQNIPPLDPWVATTSPSNAITQRAYGKTIEITGLTAGQCLKLDANNLLTSTACGGGGGGGGGGWTFGAGYITNSTSTDQVLIDESSTSSAAKLEVNGAANIKGGASSTALTVSGNSWLTGFIDTASSTVNAQLNLQQASSTLFTVSGMSWLTGFLSAASSTINGQLNAQQATTTALTVTGNEWHPSLTASRLLALDQNGMLIASSTIGINLLAANTISGVSLGGTLNALSNDGATLSGSSYNGSSAVSNWAVNLGNSNSWTASTTFQKVVNMQNASTSLASILNLWMPGQSAGCAQYDANGKLTSTGTNCGTGSGGGADSFTHPTSGSSATTSLMLLNGNASTTLFSVLQTLFVGGTSTSTINGNGATSTLNSTLTVATTSQTALNVNDQYGSNILRVSTASTTAGYDLLELWSATSSGALFGVNQYGHVFASSTAPVLSSCGTSPSITSDSSDYAGTITVGSTASGCTLSFGTPFTTGPHCVLQNETGSVTNTFSYTESTTGFTVTETSLGGDKIDYICTGR